MHVALIIVDERMIERECPKPHQTETHMLYSR